MPTTEGAIAIRYRNASEILPDALLRELQKYVSGEALYIPALRTRKQWGAESGARDYYDRRNQEIRRRYTQEHASPEALAEEYGLSPETVRKLLYT